MASTLALVLGYAAGAYAFHSGPEGATYGRDNDTVLQFSTKIRDKYGPPIYTLRVPGQRIYVISSLSLIGPFQRQFKTIAFAPIEAQAAAGVMGVGSAGNATIGSEKMFDDDSYLSTFVPSIIPSLSPGPGLDALNSTAIRYISEALADLHGNTPTIVELFSWISDQICMATTEAMYGPRTLFATPPFWKRSRYSSHKSYFTCLEHG